MTAVLFDYPKSAAFGRVLPKSKIYEHGSPSSAVKALFVRQVEQIVWQYKLAPETVNLAQTHSVPEIQVFSIALKAGDLKSDVLSSIDKAIPFPIIFELRYDGQTKAIAAYKRPSEADRSKWVVNEYFETDWLPGELPRIPLPVVLDLGVLYSHMLTTLMPFPARSGEGLQAFIARMEILRSRKRELRKCEARLRKEKQFNRKVAINSELRALKQEIKTLARPLAAATQ